jgi:hypothetical protein
MSNKITFSVVAAAALIQLLNKQRDAVALDIFSDTIRFASQVKSTPAHRQMLFGRLEAVLNDKPGTGTTNITQNLHEIAEKAGRRSLIVIFSDMLESLVAGHKEQDIFDALQHLKHNKHEVILFYVHDRMHELDFEFENRPYVFVDMETGERVKLTPTDIKENYVNRMQGFYKELKLKCAQYRIDLVEADINKGFDQILTPYILKRAKMY